MNELNIYSDLLVKEIKNCIDLLFFLTEKVYLRLINNN